MKPEITHKDMLGRECRAGDTIAFSQFNGLCIGKITKNTAKRVQCSRYTKDGLNPWSSYQLPETFLKLDDPAVLTWLLKGAKNKWSIVYGE